MRFHFLVTGDAGLNAIEQATARLAEAVERAGHAVLIVPWGPGSLATDSADADALVLPYNPFMWGRRGFAPHLVRDVAEVRRLRRRPLLVLIVHEPYVPITSLKSLLMGGWQRAQLVSLICLADRRFASIEAWSTRMSKLRPTDHLPSGSNLPDARAERLATRRELRVEGTLVVASLSTGHPSHLAAYVEASLAGLAKCDFNITFFQLGSGSVAVAAPHRVRVFSPGRLPSERLAALVAASDLFLAPFVDGVSTRRTSFMAALCAQVAVVGTRGTLTDPMLIGRGLELVETGDPEPFTRRVVQLAADDQRRARAADAGRALFDAEFTPDAIATRLIDAIGAE